VLHSHDMMRLVSRLVRHGSAELVGSLAAVALILVLGILQFRWFDELNHRERESRRIRLAANVSRFCEALDMEITRAYLTFALDGDAVARRDAREATRDYEIWQRQARYPRLLRGLWIAEPVEPVGPSRATARPASWRFLHLDVATGSFAGTELPQQLQSLGRRLERPETTAPLLPPLDEGTLSIISPIFIRPAFPESIRESPGPASTDNSVDVQPLPATQLRFAILQLDREYLLRELLPALARQYFSEASGSTRLDYRIVIVRNRAPHTLVYISDPAEGSAVPAIVDATGALFGIRSSLTPVGSTVLIQTPVAPPAPRGALQVSGRVTVFSSNEAEYWQLRVTHRAGSLEALATRERRQNLLLTAMSVALLGGSVVLLLVALRRSLLLNRQRMEFVAGVSHELRTPVAVMRMTGANLADGLVTEPEEVRRYGNLVQRESRRLTEMTEQVLSLARLESPSAPAAEHMSPEELIRAALESKQPEINDLGFRCAIRLEKLLPAVRVSRSSLERAIQNLISNALKYSGVSREIRIRAGKEERRGRTWVWIAVEDDGMGIEAAELSSIFEPFQRGRAAIEQNIPGTGLGLSLVQRIVRSYGGEVHVRSQPGKGSIFTLYLPAERR